MSQVFTPELVSAFVSKLKAPSPDVKIMTREEFFIWFLPNITVGYEGTRGAPVRRKFYYDYFKLLAANFVTDNISDVCVSGSINPEYVAETFEKLYSDDPEYDALFAVHNPNYDFESTLGPLSHEEKLNQTLEHKMKKILGFFFSQKGECHDAPNVICVNLICIKKPLKPLKYK